MADGMTGIEKLRRASTQTRCEDCSICEASGIEIDCDEHCNDERGRALAAIADQIEREHAEELAAEKRDMTDEAREAVERLLGIDVDDVDDAEDVGRLVYAAVMDQRNWPKLTTSRDDFRALRGRLIELIEHGGKQDVDVAALRELADEIEHATSCDQVECAYFGIDGESCDGCPAKYYDCTTAALENISERIRKEIEGAPEPDAESDSERACAALLDWRDQVAGLLGIDCGSMADEVQDAIMAELDKRLMPPGMEWMRFGDGKRVEFGDAWLDGVGDPHVLHAVEFRDREAAEMGARVIMRGRTYSNDDSIEYNLWPGERVKRPQTEVLGADGEPIKVGETVWDSTSPNDPTSSTVWRHGGPLKVLRRNDVRAGFVICENDQGIPLDCYAAELTHAAPDTQERIDDDATLDPATYCDEVLGWGAEKIVHRTDYAAQNEAMIADLLRRQRELDAKTTGGAR